jgi:hypothetical protein
MLYFAYGSSYNTNKSKYTIFFLRFIDASSKNIM